MSLIITATYVSYTYNELHRMLYYNIAEKFKKVYILLYSSTLV